MVGVEFCVAAFVEPALRKLPEPIQIAAAPDFAKRLGTFMPFWYATSLLLALADLWVTHRDLGLWSPWIGGAAGVIAFVIAVTILALVPINNRLARMRAAYPDWQKDAARWDGLHRARVFFLFVALVLLGLGQR